MKRFCLFIAFLYTFNNINFAQISINISGTNPDPSAGLDVSFTNRGVLIPRIALTSATDNSTIPSPATSLLVYNLGTGGLSPAGYYYWNGSQWVMLGLANHTHANLTFNNSGTGSPSGSSYNGSSSLTISYNTIGAIGGSGTPTQVAFWNTSNTLSSNANLFWDNVNFRLGIGTATPTYQLTLGGTSTVFGVENTATFVAKNASGSYEPYLWPRWSDNAMYLNYGSNGFYIRNNSSSVTMFMNNAGNVGIGTTTPAYRLDLAQGTFAFGNANVRTETRDNAGLQGNAGAQSGFFETSNPTNFPSGASSWWHLIDCRHSNNSNNYAMQIAGSFFDQFLWFRKTNNNPSENWKLITATYGFGNAGQILTSQGANNTPTWQSTSSLPFIGDNISSVKLSTLATNTNQSAWTTLLTLNVTPQSNTIYVFASFGARLTDNSGNAQFGQAIIIGRITANGVEQAKNASVITDYDYGGGSYIVTSGSVSFAGIPVNVTPGVPVTITLEWRPSVLWATSPWRVQIDPSTALVGDHAVLTVFE
ncbi:MAG: hypothetical protein N2449_03900 [Bacteroidales bacterium]|nr:hypothetical protein [Bacteroidales bacterium]